MSADTSSQTGFAETYGRLWRSWLAPHRALLLTALAMTAFGALAAGAYSKLIQLVMAALERAEANVIWWGPLAVATLTLSGAVAQYLKETLSSRAITRMETELQKEMFAQLVRADLARLQAEAPAALAARFSSDILLVGQAVRGALGAVSHTLTVIFTIIVMFTIDPALTVMMVVVFSMALLPVSMIGRRLRKLAGRTQAEIAHMTSEVTEGLSGIRMARTYRLEAPLTESAAGVFEGLFGLRLKQYVWRARVSPLMEVLIGLAVAVLLFVVARRIHAGTFSVADFTGLLTGLGVLTGPARRLGGTFATMMQGRAALDRIYALFDAQNTILDGPERIARAEGRISFDNVGFAYPDGETVLHDFSLDIAPGMRVALVGRSGAGKSTVFNLLPRLYDPVSGAIRLDGRDIRELTLDSLRDQIAVVSQDSVLLSASVAANIGFGRREATRAEIEAAARDAAADGFIGALPQGYDTPVAPARHAFSGGERQRLSIARAILRDAPVLLLDEATSALDAESEAQIRAALSRLSVGRTTLIIAHRLATVRDCDLIVVMDKGRIVEKGTHEALLAAGGLYAELSRLQLSGD